MKHRVLSLMLGVVGLLGSSATAPSPSVPVIDGHPPIGLMDGPITPCYQGLTGGGPPAWVSILGPATVCYAAEIGEATDRHGVDPLLVYAVIEVESSFDPWAVSRKGAQGLMQLMPQTAALLGVRDPFNPRQNIDGGVRHLRGLMDRYGGNLRLALAAYNAGEQAVDWYRGIPPYAETQEHIQRVLSLYGKGPGEFRRLLRPPPTRSPGAPDTAFRRSPGAAL